jgi:hypothetical protein
MHEPDPGKGENAQPGSPCLSLIDGINGSVLLWLSLLGFAVAFYLWFKDREAAAYMILAVVSVPVFLYNHRYKKRCNYKRFQTLRPLHNRPPADLRQEFAAIAERGRIPVADVERLWVGLANFYEIPTDRFRASDILKEDLAGIRGHIDYDPFFCGLIHLHKGPASDALEEVVNWGELITCFYQFEQETGKLGTKIAEKNGHRRCVWDGDGNEPATNHCLQCRYNLKGNTSGNCPECGAAINVTSPLCI